MSQMRHDAVFAGSLTKTWRSWWRKTEALRELTLRIPVGSAFGLLGPNGAGKTTFVKILIGAVRATAGTATVFGHEAGSLAARAMVGYVPESSLAPLHLTGTQLIDFQSSLYGMGRGERRRRTAALLEQVGMRQWADVPMRQYSRGMRQRVCIAAALAHEPRMLILDEPTDGLDPASRREILELLRRLNRQQGVTLLVNSHLLHEVEELCSEVAMLRQGRLVRTGSLAQLRTQAGYTVVLRSERADLEALFAERGIAALREAAGTLRLHVVTREELDWTLDLARAAAAQVVALGRSTHSLETIYLTETRPEEEARR